MRIGSSSESIVQRFIGRNEDGYRYEIRLSGSGGQGLILMGIILAEAIGIYDGKYVAQTQSYGPEARGGSSKSEVIVSDEEIDYPKAMKPRSPPGDEPEIVR